MPIRRVVGLAIALLLCGATEAPYDAADPSAPEVTQDNLLGSERFWPFHVRLSEEKKTPQGRVPAGIPGVLVRVTAAGDAVIDWGRRGIYAIPVDQTNLLEQANRIRTGEESKILPNATLAFGRRLFDAESGAPLRYFGADRFRSVKAYVILFADPDSPQFEALATALQPFNERRDVLTALFPQGNHRDETVLAFLGDHAVPEGFLARRFVRSLVRSYLAFLDDPGALPLVLALTAEGRALGAWESDELDPKAIAESLERGAEIPFGSRSAAGAAGADR